VTEARLVRALVIILAASVGVLSLAVARDDPVGSYAGLSTLGGVAELAAGWALVAAGLLFRGRHPGNPFGVLLVAAGFAWFVPEWSNPGVGSALVFTSGLAGFVACPPLVAHAALVYPSGRLRSRVDAAVVAALYACGVVLLGVVATTVFDPKATGCSSCPRNLLLVHGNSSLYHSLNRLGFRAALVLLVVVAALLVWRVARGSRAFAPMLLPALVPALAYLAFVAWDLQHSLGRGFLANDAEDRRLWRLEAAALVAFALAVGWALLRERQARASVARLVVELGRLPTPGRVRDALAEGLHDPSLQLAYRRRDGDGYIDAGGRALELDPAPDRAVTPLRRGDATVAALVHDPRLLERPGLLDEVVAPARLAVENEQLQAEVRAQLAELQASRTRIVETADSERRRLERDLHDGAQQRLLALSYDLRVTRAAAETAGRSDLATLLESAGDEAQTAIAELRELAHGIYPAILAEAGLAAALETLADEAKVPVDLDVVPGRRYGPLVEATAYLTVAEAVAGAARRGATSVSVGVLRDGDVLDLSVVDDAAGAPGFAHLADRVGALGGTLEISRDGVRARIPCA
jgi:signal transduction histidine kinase